MSQYRRCENCRHACSERNENGEIVCSLFYDEHIAYDKCQFWEDANGKKKKRKK